MDTQKTKDLFDLAPRDLEKALTDLSRAEVYEAAGGMKGILGIFNGRVFTSFSRNSKRYLNVDDIEVVKNTTPIRLASTIIFDNADKIIDILQDEPVDFTVFYSYDNSVKSTLWFDQASDTGRSLNKKLSGTTYTVNLEVPISIDGTNVSRSSSFVKIVVSPPKHLLRNVIFTRAVKTALEDIHHFLDAKSSIGSVQDLLDARVSSDDTSLRGEKDEVLETFKSLKVQVLQSLADAANLDSKNQSFLLVFANGKNYVIHNPESVQANSQVKQPEREIKGSISSTAETAVGEARGGIVGNMYIRIAELLGNRDLAVVRNIKTAMSTQNGSSKEELLQSIAKKFREPKDIIAIKTKISAIVKATINEIDEYVNSIDDPSLLNTIKLVSAEAKKDLSELLASVKASSSFIDIISSLYGKFANDQQLKNTFESKGRNMTLNLLKSIVEDTTNGVMGSATVSSSIAPTETHLQKNRMIIRRKRNPAVIKPKFTKPKAKIAEAMFNRKDSDGSDAGKNDMSNGVADVKFSMMRNAINARGDSITGSDVADYLERAAVVNDEVDTVAFGLETSDNEIVKVYVNAEQADAFEGEMKNLLGVEDDIENAINTLAQKFDIVDVVWPDAPEVDEVEDDEAFDELGDEFDDNEFDVLDGDADIGTDFSDTSDEAYDKI